MRRLYRSLNRTGLVVLICLLSHVGAAVAVSASSIEELTLAYLYNFLKFTEWPAVDSINEMTICVSKAGRLAANPDALAGRLAQNKKVVIKSLDTLKDPRTCQILFLDQTENSLNISQWLKQTEKLPILTVSDKPDFLDMGGMIMLIEADNRLQFEVDLTGVRNAGLNLNSQVLKIARDVRGK